MIKSLIAIVCLSVLGVVGYSATVTVTVTWSTGWCSICGNQTGNYSCNPPYSGSGQWNNGIRTFADPVPNGNKVTGVSVVVNKVNCGYTNLCVNLNGVTVQCLPPSGGNCGCGTCWPQTYSNTWPCPNGIPSYVYGGTNQIQLVNTGTICVNSAVITLTYEPCCPMTAAITNFADPLCNGDCNGSATLTQSNGASPFTYIWSSGGTTDTETGLCAGTYYATVTDANNCTAIDSITLVDPPLLTSTTTQTDISCNGANDGDATVTANGGTTPYSYAWSNSGTGTMISGLSAGTYTVTVTDNNGCTSVSTVTITEPPLLTSSITSFNDVACNGGNSGDATVTANGGTTAYSYAWSSGGTGTTETGLTAGTYTVTVTDNNGCTSVSTVTITEPSPLVITLMSSTDISCNGLSDGDITINASGGTTGYTYNWSSGGSGTTESGLAAGVYTVTVTDANNCTETTTVTLTEPTLLTSSVTATDVLCNGAATGDATVTAAGGTTPYVYAWSNGGFGVTESFLTAGPYTVTVTDNNGCTSVSDVTINEPTAISPFINALDVTCSGSCDGNADLTVVGGITPYTYSWSTGALSEDITGLCTGMYTVTITDANNCVVTLTTPINVGDWSPVADFTPDPRVTDIRNTEIHFIDNSSGDVTQWSWTFYSLDSSVVLAGSNEQNPVLVYPSTDKDTGTYCVYLEVTDDAGCKSDTTRCIRIDGIYEIFTPNAFTPNGDGVNDYFFPQGVGINDEEFTLFIYDRWGEVIFESHRLADKWDGIAHSKGGNSVAPQDVYVWKLITKDSIKHLEHEYIGHVTLIR